jgi:histidinol dehydrogenase
MLNLLDKYDDFLQKLHGSNQGTDRQEIIDLLQSIKVDIQKNKDKAVIKYSAKFDKVFPETFSLTVSEAEIKEAYTSVPKTFIDACKRAKSNIESYHRLQLPKDINAKKDNGVEFGITYNALDIVGLYVPGGRAPYPSTVLMDAIPAKLAGVQHVVMTTPPQANGKVAPQILVAADICKVDTIIKAGGAQGIFALAYGTESIPKVDKIVGPGNIYVDLAKQMVYGTVDIDKPAGPSDVCIYIEKPEYASYAASEMLAQLEHDPLSIAITVSSNKETLTAIQKEFETQLDTLSRKKIIVESKKNSALLLTSTEKESIDIINKIAAEHLVILTDTPHDIRKQIKHAGSIFLGPYTPVTLGDYFAGPNHVLPTSGAAKYASPLGVMDFMKYSSYLNYSKEALEKAKDDLKILTEMEGFDGHFNAVTQRL